MKLTTKNLTDVIRNRFWIKVDKQNPNECWPWKGANNGRYGTMTIYKQTVGAHKVSYLIHHGDVPDGVFVLHSCDNTWCVNPSHLFLGTHAQNMLDKTERGEHRGERINTAKLTPPAVLLIRRCYKDGHYSQHELAEITGLSQPNIGMIVTGKTWNHVEK